MDIDTDTAPRAARLAAYPTDLVPAPARPSATASGGYTLRGRKWLFGATLAAAGLVAGGGAYAAVAGPGVGQGQAVAAVATSGAALGFSGAGEEAGGE